MHAVDNMITRFALVVLSLVLAVLATAGFAAGVVALGVPFPPLLGWPVFGAFLILTHATIKGR